MRITGRRLFAALVTVVVVAASIVGLWLIDPPGVERQRRLDTRRFNDLHQIAAAVDGHWKRHDSLPPDLAAVNEQPGVSIPLEDPISGEPYGYRQKGDASYELCAVFETEATHHRWRHDPFAHGPGRHCLDFDAGSRER